MKAEIFMTICNGMYIIPFFLDHYEEKFPGCPINIFNDGSIDGSVEYCESRGYKVNDLGYKGHMEIRLRDFKNKAWKNSEAEWIIVVDQDEMINISLADLDSLGDCDVIRFKGYNMYGLEGQVDPREFTHGLHHRWYDKCLLFKKSIGDINYFIGSHQASPTEGAKICSYDYDMYHYPKRLSSKEAFLDYMTKVLPKNIVLDMYEKEISILKKIIFA